MTRSTVRPLIYPKTEVRDVAETRFGATVHDPYRWLEADVRVHPKAWNQSTLMVQEGLDGVPRLLLDPNSWASDGTTAIGEWSSSRIPPITTSARVETTPAILTTTADTDDRVMPSHSFKYAAALQAAQIGRKPHLLRVESRAGHGMGKPLAKLIEEVSDMRAFVGHFTGLTHPPREHAA
jgi:protease II